MGITSALKFLPLDLSFLLLKFSEDKTTDITGTKLLKEEVLPRFFLWKVPIFCAISYEKL